MKDKTVELEEKMPIDEATKIWNDSKPRNKAILYSLVEGGMMQPLKVDVYEDELSNYNDSVQKREVFSKKLQVKINTRSVKIGDKYVHALFFEDGKAFDCGLDGFKERVGYADETTKAHFNKIYKEKTNAN